MNVGHWFFWLMFGFPIVFFIGTTVIGCLLFAITWLVAGVMRLVGR